MILVQLAEAHSTAWPINFENNRHTPQRDFEDRRARAAAFSAETRGKFEVFVCGWDNEFEFKFRAWPDKYYMVNKDFVVLEHSRFIRGGEYDAVVSNDYALLLRDLLAEGTCKI